ncbi:MAG TPA: ester cyclase [Cyclobacteriaceae bacterium]|nr:ester cyclase [Cyclobacteriaceae bacterium]
MKSQVEENKAVVLRFNKEFIEQGNMKSFKELVSDQVINHAAPAGTPSGPESMRYFIIEVLRKGFPDIKVEILDQVADGDRICSRKALSGTHTGEFMGLAPTNKKVTFNVIDIIRIENGKYAEHWGISNIPEVLKTLSEK